MTLPTGPPLRLRTALVTTPEVASVVLQPAAGTAPSVYVAPLVTPVTATAGAVASRLTVIGAAFIERPALLVQDPLNVAPAVSVA